MQGKRLSIGSRAALAIFTATLFVTSTLAAAQERVLHNFNGTDGDVPAAGLIFDNNGNLYGTTSQGGTGNCYNGYGDIHCGTVFELSPIQGGGWTETVLYSFNWNGNGTDGTAPLAGLIFDAAGNLYGTTYNGGTSADGTVFELTPAAGGTWTEKVLWSFGNGTDGTAPLAGLIFDAAGNLYGTTVSGGTYGNGTVFELTPAAGGTWTEKVLWSFGNGTDGYQPFAGLIFDAAGNLYGTTSEGGTYLYNGTVFELTPTAGGGWTEQVLHSFNYNGTDGVWPYAGLIFDAAGNLYGTTESGGGGTYGSGTVFELTPTGGGGWTEKVLHSFFCSPFNCTDGYSPRAGLIFDAAGNLYGTTYNGGTYQYGTVFELTPAAGGGWTETVLYSFGNGTDGVGPVAGLIFDAAGNLYGTTAYGGTGVDGLNEGGTVFELESAANYTLTVSTVGNGTVTSTDGFISCPGTCSHSYPPNTQVTLNATPSGGWTFSGWSGACSGTGPCVVTMTQSLSVGATFTQNPIYTLTVTTSGNGTVTSTDGYITCPGTCSQSYLSNTQVTLNATPAAGWAFSGWGGACNGTGSCVVTMTQNLSVGATFTQLSFTLTVAPIGSGTVTSTDGFISCPGTCSHSYLSNTQVTLNAAPGQGWVFGGWNGGCSGTASCTVTMTQSLTVDAIFSQAQQLVAVTPCRLVDTRQTGDPIQGGTSQSYILPQLGGCNVSSSAAAYSLNVTVVPHGALGYLTIWPTGEAQPVVSTMNSPDGRTKANAAIVPAGTSGAVSVYVTNTSDVILDIDGYFAPPGSQTYQFYPLTPCRLVDTRGADGDLGGPRLAAQAQRSFPLLESTTCIPTGLNPLAYSLNFTVIPNPSRQQLGYLSVWPAGDTQPVVSTLNNPTATVVANAAIVPAGTDGDIDVYAFNTTDLLIDINGYFAAPGTGGLSLYPAAPCRVLDTRQNHGQPFMGEKTVNVVGSTCAPPSSAQAYVFNATVVPPGSMPYLTLWPDGELRPVASTLNAYDGFITSNMAIVPTNNGSIDAYAAALTQLLLDISGYFAP